MEEVVSFGVLIAAVIVVVCWLAIRKRPSKIQIPTRHTGIDFSARDRARADPREIRWEEAVYAKLTEGGVKPDVACTCYFMTGSDRADVIVDYADGGIGIYREAKLIRIIVGEDDDCDHEGKLAFLGINDRNFSDIYQIILRERTTPKIMNPTPIYDHNNIPRYVPYERYFQTRIYDVQAREGGSPPRSTYRLFSQDSALYNWLIQNTGVKGARDTQGNPLDGYPDQ